MTLLCSALGGLLGTELPRPPPPWAGDCCFRALLSPGWGTPGPIQRGCASLNCRGGSTTLLPGPVRPLGAGSLGTGLYSGLATPPSPPFSSPLLSSLFFSEILPYLASETLFLLYPSCLLDSSSSASFSLAPYMVVSQGHITGPPSRQFCPPGHN